MVSGLTFISFMSTTGQIPKALAFRPNLLFELYNAAPLVSLLLGVAAVVLALVALALARGPVGGAIAGALAGTALFVAVMLAVSRLEFTLAPPSAVLDGPIFPSFAVTPPAIAMTALGIGTAAALVAIKGASRHRPAIAALTIGAAVGFYWVLVVALLWFSD